jgi:hypothetical protein
LRLTVFAFASAAVLSSGAASAQIIAPGASVQHEETEELRYPVAEAERPITLPAMVLSPELDLDIVHAPGAYFGNATLGASFGLLNDLTVRATVIPLQLAAPGGAHFGESSETLGPSVGATFRVLKKNIELGLSLDVGIITAQGESGLWLTPGVPVRVHIGKRIRIDTGGYFTLSHGSTTVITPLPMGNMTTNPTSTVGALSIPLSFLFDVTEPIHVGALTGFTITDFSRPGDTAGIPIGVFAGYAVAGKEGPIFDIDPFFTWTSFVTPGGNDFFDVSDWALGVSLGGFLYL